LVAGRGGISVAVAVRWRGGMAGARAGDWWCWSRGLRSRRLTGLDELDHEGTDMNRSTYNDASKWHIDKVLCSYVPQMKMPSISRLRFSGSV